MRPEAMQVEALKYARVVLDYQARAGKLKFGTYDSNFPPAAFFLEPGGEVKVAWEFHENQRFRVLRQFIQQLDATAFCLVYDGRVSRLEDGVECEYCDGAGCDECCQSGKARKGEKQDAIVMVEMKKGEKNPKVTYTPYAVLGGKVICEKPFTIGISEPLDGPMEAKHEYAQVWEEQKEQTT